MRIEAPRDYGRVVGRISQIHIMHQRKQHRFLKCSVHCDVKLRSKNGRCAGEYSWTVATQITHGRSCSDSTGTMGTTTRGQVDTDGGCNLLAAIPDDVLFVDVSPEASLPDYG